MIAGLRFEHWINSSWKIIFFESSSNIQKTPIDDTDKTG
jgi:hypothetical protein